MPGSIFCPKCGKRWRSERHACQPSAVQAKTRKDKQYAPAAKK